MAAKTANAVNIVGTKEVSPFYDVAKEHQYYNEICALVNMGVISGYGNGYFRPNDNATYDAAYKMFSYILGYGFAEGRYSYIEMAKMAGILDGFKSNGKGLTIGDAMVLAYNTLHSSMLIATEFSGDSAISTNSNIPALEHYHGYVRIYGVVEGANGTTLATPDETITQNEILIGGKRYECENAQSYLGKTVAVYAEKEQLDEYRVAPFYMYEDEDKNSVFTVKAEDIIGLSGNKFSYYEGTKEKSITISGGTDVLYNDMAHPDYTASDFAPTDGAVHFIDNNDNGDYDVVMIDSYYYAVVEKVDSESGVVYCEYPENKTIGNKDAETIFSMESDGRLMYFGSLSEGAAVAVKESKNTTGNKKVSFELISEMRSGKVTGMSSDSITIGEETFKLTNGSISDETVRLGDAVNAYVLDGNCVVMLHNDGSTYNLGYLIDVEVVDDVFADSMRVKIIDYSRNTLFYDCVENLKIDGDSYKDRQEDAANHIKSSAALSEVHQSWPYAQLIRYVVGVDGKIKNIDTAYYDASNEAEDSLQRYTRPGSTPAVSDNVTYWSASGGFHLSSSTTSLQYIATSSTKIFGVPFSFRDDENWYLNGLPSNGSTYGCEAYNVDEGTREAKYIVKYVYPVTSTGVGNRPQIVKSVSQVIDDEGELAYKVTTLGVEERARIIKPEIMDTSIKEGDLIRAIGDYKSHIISMSKVLSVDDGEISESSRIMQNTAEHSKTLPSMRMIYGSAVSLTKTHLLQTTSIKSDVGGVANLNNLNAYKISDSTPIYVYDSNDKTVYTGELNDIITYHMSEFDCSEMFVCSSYGSIEYIYIIK
jgi:hypothetical protein